jgi:hypothetical protein
MNQPSSCARRPHGRDGRQRVILRKVIDDEDFVRLVKLAFQFAQKRLNILRLVVDGNDYAGEW